MSDPIQWHGTTILSVRKNGKVVIAGDGQVSMGQTVMKPNARKVRRLGDGAVIGGGMGHRVRGIIAGLHTFYPLRVLARSARVEIGLLLLACLVATVAIATGYWMALPRRLRARVAGRR